MSSILIAGASGYVGSRLLRRLEQAGVKTTCLARNPDDVPTQSLGTDVIRGDLMERTSLWKAFRDVDTAYYLAHALPEKNFELKELEAAENFAGMARNAGVQRIIYLGALASEKDHLSRHLQSRLDTGYALRMSGVPTIELRASIVIGNGSTPFDLLRDLTDHLPFMITPSWLSTPTQPIAINDLLSYLIEATRIPADKHRIIEIGGADQISYGALMKEYARQRGYRRIMVPVPVLSPGLSSHWIALFSRVNPATGRRLIESIRNATVVTHPEAAKIFHIEPQRAGDAIAAALAESRTGEIRYVHAA